MEGGKQKRRRQRRRLRSPSDVADGSDYEPTSGSGSGSGGGGSDDDGIESSTQSDADDALLELRTAGDDDDDGGPPSSSAGRSASAAAATRSGTAATAAADAADDHDAASSRTRSSGSRVLDVDHAPPAMAASSSAAAAAEAGGDGGIGVLSAKRTAASSLPAKKALPVRDDDDDDDSDDSKDHDGAAMSSGRSSDDGDQDFVPSSPPSPSPSVQSRKSASVMGRGGGGGRRSRGDDKKPPTRKSERKRRTRRAASAAVEVAKDEKDEDDEEDGVAIDTRSTRRRRKRLNVGRSSEDHRQLTFSSSSSEEEEEKPTTTRRSRRTPPRTSVANPPATAEGGVKKKKAKAKGATELVLDIDPTPRYGPRPNGSGASVRYCSVRGCDKFSRGLRCHDMCRAHHAQWKAATPAAREIATALAKSAVEASAGDDGKAAASSDDHDGDDDNDDDDDDDSHDGDDEVNDDDHESSPPPPPPPPRRRGRKRASSDHNGDDDGGSDGSCRPRSASGKARNNTATGRPRKGRGATRGVVVGGDDEGESVEVVKVVTSPKSKKCKVPGCAKFKQNGRDGMCAAHFNASNAYGVEEILASGVELLGSRRKKNTGSAKKRGPPSPTEVSPVRRSSERPTKKRRWGAQHEEKTPPSPRSKPKSPAEKKRGSAQKERPSSSPRAKLSSPRARTKTPEEKLGLPPPVEGKALHLCLVGDCTKHLQQPRKFHMCRLHYREIVAPLKARELKQFAAYSQKWKVLGKKTASGGGPRNVTGEIEGEAEERAETSISGEGVDDENLHSDSSRQVVAECPAFSDHRRAPPISKDTIHSTNKHVCSIWETLPSSVALNSAPPLPLPVHFGVGTATATSADIPPMPEDQNAIVGSASVREDSIHLDPRYNYNVILLAAKARLGAKNPGSALLLCQKALFDWYDRAEKCARFHRTGGGEHPEISTTTDICNGLGGLWCVYAWLLLEFAKTNSKRALSNKDADSANADSHEEHPKFPSEFAIPEGLFNLSNDNVQLKDVLAALKVATECSLAGRCAWPWLARARVAVLAGQEGTVSAQCEEAASRHAHQVGVDESDNPKNMVAGLRILNEAYRDAILICHEGIERLSPLPFVCVSDIKRTRDLIPIHGLAEPEIDQEAVKSLCNEINCISEMKSKVEASMASHIKERNGVITSRNGIDLSNGPARATAPNDRDDKLQQHLLQHDLSSSKSKTVDAAFHSVEWVCIACKAQFTHVDRLRSHKTDCKASNASSTRAAKEGTGGRGDASTSAAPHFPTAGAPVYDEEEAADVLDYLVELFPATEVHLGRKMVRHNSPAKGEPLNADRKPAANKAGFVGQVGLQCIYCRDVDESMVCPCAVVYPYSVGELHRAMWRMRVSHFEHCRNLPDDARARYEVMRNSLAPDGDASRRYWDKVAVGLGLEGVQTGGIIWPESGEKTTPDSDAYV